MALGRTRRELLASLTSQELTEWLAFARLEPFGHPIESFRFGTLAAAAWNAPARKWHATAQDFQPAQDAAKPAKMSADAAQGLFLALATATGGGIHGSRRTVSD